MKNYYRLFLVALAAFSLLVGANAQKTATIKKLPASASVTIDGVEDESFWGDAEEFKGLTYVNASPDNDTDHDLHYWKSVWNDTAIFFLFKIEDFNVYPYDFWAADQVELYFRFGGKDILRKDIFSYTDSGVFQVALRITESGYAKQGYSLKFIDTNKYYCQTTTYQILETYGYTIEAYILWDMFVEYSDTAEGDTIPVKPVDGYTFNFDANCQDNDTEPDRNDDAYKNDVVRGYWSSNRHLWEGNWDTMTPGTMILDGNYLSIEEQTIDQLDIYPNPVQDELIIQGGDVDVDEAVIYSITGKAVLRSSLANTSTINVSELYNGVYLLELYNEGEYLGTKKIIVAKEE